MISWAPLPLALLAATAWSALASPAQARIEAEALLGRPFGVARVRFTGADAGVAIDASRVLLEERNGRVLYPAATPGPIGRIVGRVLGDAAERPSNAITVHFLFRGDEPLELTIYTPQAVPLTIQPQPPANPRAFDRQFTHWWRQYNAYWRQLRAEDNHPPLVSTYLTAMLSQRMGLEPPLVERLANPAASTQTTRALELLAGTERLRLETMRQTMLGGGDFGQQANVALPRGVAWSPLALPPELPDVRVEPISLRVPHDWFYVRFGRFSNYLWLNNLIDEYGGDISSMVTLRSYLAPMNQRVQRQLGLEQNVLAELLGEQVISDVALVGRDVFTREGAAIGILFQARNDELLVDDLQKQRRRALERERSGGATSETLQIGGREVSFFATPDNRLRSYYAAKDGFHLVTTSRAMVEQFLSIEEGRGSLGQSAEFRFTRSNLPLDRGDTVFVYFSAAFFQGLMSPNYQVELERRLKSVTDLEVLQLARLAARAERVRAESIGDLVAAGLLPPGFGQRPDGSGPLALESGLVDSRRRARGTFTPIPDVPIAGVTREEASRLEALSATLAQGWRRMDPLVAGIQRYALDQPDRERIVIDSNISPIDESKYGWVISMLGPPTRQMITTSEDDIIAVQAVLRGGLLSPSIPPHHMFLGIQNIPPLANIPPSGLLQTYNMLRSTPGYLGAWPQPGFLDLLPWNLGGTIPDPDGFSRLPLGLWRRQGAGFSVLSFDPVLLANVTPQLRVVEGETEAQIRIHAGDLSTSKIQPWITGLYYQRALTASAGNVKLMHQLNQQLHVPMSEARDAAEDLLDASLACPLGGEYELVEEIGGARVWQSSAWSKRSLAAIPDDFEAPLLKWFRGLDASVNKVEDQVIARVELDVQRQPGQPRLQLPSFFDFFRGGGQGALKPKEEPPSAEELPPPLPPVERPPRRDDAREPPPPPPRPPLRELPGAREL
jgi:hypothetical protein